MRLVDIFFPPSCLHCGAPLPVQERWLCSSCLSCIQYNNNPLCLNCGSFPCICSSPHICYAPFLYEGPIRSLIHAYKYRGFEAIGNFFVSLFEKQCSRSPLFIPGSPSLVPVPMHKYKSLSRPFDHTHHFSSLLSKIYSLPQENMLKRVRHTPPQSIQKTVQQRKENVEDAFVCTQAPPNQVILVDDVLTSGATIRACEKPLRKRGVSFCYTYAISLSIDLQQSVQQEK